MQSPLPDPQELLRVVIEDATDYAFLVLDARGTIATWNRGAEALFGFREEDIVGRHVSTLFTVEDVRERVPEMEMEMAIAEGRAIDSRWHVRNDATRSSRMV